MFPSKEKAPKKNKFIVDIKNYKIIRQIKSGSFGSVYLVENKYTKEISAAKVVIMTDETSKYKKMINLEIGIMIRCQHPTIINFLGYSFNDFYDQKNFTIFMKYAEKGSLADILKKVKKSLADVNYDNTTRQIILIGIARSMKYLHENNIIHRDLKPDNVLIDEDLHPKLSDFGLSKSSQTIFATSQSMQCGTNIYMAPEMIEGKRCSGKVDVYSFAILMYEVVTDSVPYPLFSEGKMTLSQLHKKILKENYRPSFNVYVKKPIKKLIEKCWSNDPNERPTFDEIYNKLAYNRKDSIYDICDEYEEEDSCENEYYLDGADENEIQSYLDDIDDESNYNNEVEKVNEKLKQIESQIDSLNEENKYLKKSIKNIKKENTAIIIDNKEIKKSIKNIQKVNDELKESIEILKNTADQLKNENEEKKELMKSYLNENENLKLQVLKLQEDFHQFKLDTIYDEELLKDFLIINNITIYPGMLDFANQPCWLKSILQKILSPFFKQISIK